MKKFCILLLLLVSTLCYGEVSPYQTCKVIGLRIEQSWGFITFDSKINNPDSDLAHDRVWVDITTPEGRAAYSTAMFAFTTGKNVKVRGYVGEYYILDADLMKLYDIYVY